MIKDLTAEQKESLRRAELLENRLFWGTKNRKNYSLRRGNKIPFPSKKLHENLLRKMQSQIVCPIKSQRA